MGLMAWVSRVFGQGSRWFALGGTMSLLTAGLWLAPAAVSPPSAMASQGLCDLNSVIGTVHNDTGDSLALLHGSIGITNAWCTFPGNPIAPHSVNRWKAGDNLFETEVHLTYLAPNHQIISLSAVSHVFPPAEASCFVVPNGSEPRAFRCDAKVEQTVENGNTVARAEFVIQEIHP
jgi:hypothetical protein